MFPVNFVFSSAYRYILHRIFSQLWVYSAIFSDKIPCVGDTKKRPYPVKLSYKETKVRRFPVSAAGHCQLCLTLYSSPAAQDFARCALLVRYIGRYCWNKRILFKHKKTAVSLQQSMSLVLDWPYTFKTTYRSFHPILFPNPSARIPCFWSSPRPISIGQLHALLHFHLRPIYLVVFKGSYRFRVG